MIDELHVDHDITINRLDLIGYASPEGSLAGNKRLSEGRALALKNYLARRYSFAPSLYHIVFGGENWEGLRKALTDLDVVYKAEIELIIDNYDGQKRKERLMKLQEGSLIVIYFGIFIRDYVLPFARWNITLKISTWKKPRDYEGASAELES